VAEDAADVEAESDEEADSEDVFLEAEADTDADDEVDESDLVELDALEQEVDHAEEVAEHSDEFAEEAEAESFEQLEAEVEDVAEQTETFTEAVDSTDADHAEESALLEAQAAAASYDEVAADTMMESGMSPASGEDMRLAQGFGKVLGDAAKAGLNAAAKAAGKEIGRAVGKAAVSLGREVVGKAVDAVKKIAKKVSNSKLGQELKEGGAKLLSKAKGLAKKAIKGAKKIIDKLLHGKHHKKDHKKEKHGKGLKKEVKHGKGLKKDKKKDKKKKKHHKKHHKNHHKKDKKKCKKGAEGKKCRKEKCKKHKLGCRFKCARGGYSRRHHSKHNACRLSGGLHPNWFDFDVSEALDLALDLAEGVLNDDGTPGPNATENPPGTGPGERKPKRPTEPKPWTKPPAPKPKQPLSSNGKPMVPATLTDSANGDEHNKVVAVGKGRGHHWNGVNPRYKGQADLPPVQRLPEDVEDCVACQYVWKQVEQDVGNSAITQTIYDAFHANALDAQRTPIFYPACQTMFDAADDMIGDYMDGYTVDQVCENSMLCRPRDLNQFLKHQRVTKGI